MKKIILTILIYLNSAVLLADLAKQDLKWQGCFTAGYVFKHDQVFKQVYGPGIANLITGDLCYALPQSWGLGGKLSYWRAHGETDFLEMPTVLHEVPITLYICKMHNFDSGRQIYGSLGGGVICIKETSYLGQVVLHNGIGEVEVGFSTPLWCRCKLTSALRYLFPSYTKCDTKASIGGLELRAGLGFAW